MRNLIDRRPSPAMVVACTPPRRRSPPSLAASRRSRRTPSARPAAHGRSDQPEAPSQQLHGARAPTGHYGGPTSSRARGPAPTARPARWAAAPPPRGGEGTIRCARAGVAVPGGAAHHSQYRTRTVTVNCEEREGDLRMTAGAMTRPTQLWTQRIRPILTVKRDCFRGRVATTRDAALHAVRPLLTGRGSALCAATRLPRCRRRPGSSSDTTPSARVSRSRHAFGRRFEVCSAARSRSRSRPSHAGRGRGHLAGAICRVS